MSDSRIEKVRNTAVDNGLPIIIVDVTRGNYAWIEYYVGVDSSHPFYQTGTITDLHTLKHHSIQKAVFSSNVQVKSFSEGLAAIGKELSIIGKLVDSSESEIKDYIGENSLKAVDGAWLSYIGNDYDYLDDELCYFGGGMYVNHFGEKDCLSGALVMAGRLSTFLSQPRVVVGG